MPLVRIMILAIVLEVADRDVVLQPQHGLRTMSISVSTIAKPEKMAPATK